MSLPHFQMQLQAQSTLSGLMGGVVVPNSKPRLDVFYSNLSTVEFGEGYEELTENCFNITKRIMSFYVNLDVDTGRFRVIELIQKLISDKTTLKILEIKHVDKNNQPIAYIIIENFYFIKIKNLLDLDWNVTDLKTFRVKFQYEKATFVNNKSYNSFIRKLKLQRVENNS